jgi:uncharacterized protein (UPF0332 family)
MQLSLSELLRKGLIERLESDQQQIENEIEVAEHNLSSAKKMLTIEEWEWSHNAAYNAMLQTGRALMFSKGFRSKGGEHHLTVILFVQAVYSAKFPQEVLQAFDKARRRRNESLYDPAGSISKTQSRNLVRTAEVFVNKAKEPLRI